jgi:acetyl-CoA synthetase
VISVAGHRLGTKEIESAALTVPEVAEAAAVPVIDDIRGRVVEVYVSLKPGSGPGSQMEDKVTTAIETEIGKIARPKNVWIVPDMPKTRSGKIMRRVIVAVSNFADIGDVTTLATRRSSRMALRGQVGPNDVLEATRTSAITCRARRPPGTTCRAS